MIPLTHELGGTLSRDCLLANPDTDDATAVASAVTALSDAEEECELELEIIVCDDDENSIALQLTVEVASGEEHPAILEEEGEHEVPPPILEAAIEIPCQRSRLARQPPVVTKDLDILEPA